MLDLPRPDRYYPHCFYSAIGSSAAFKGFSPDINRIYGNHRFHIAGDAQAFGGLDLNRGPFNPGQFKNDMAAIYGFGVEEQRFSDPGAYWRALQEAIKAQDPCVIYFSLGYVKELRQYRTSFGLHFVTLAGFDDDGIWVQEQVLGLIHINRRDWEDCLGYVFQELGFASIFNVRQIGSGAAFDQETHVRRIVRDNAENLNSPDPEIGLSALSRFIYRYNSTIHDPEKREGIPNFPGLWAFSHERITSLKWLEAFGGSFRSESLYELSRALKTLHIRWLSQDVLVEKAHLGPAPFDFDAFSENFIKIQSYEILAAGCWAELLS